MQIINLFTVPEVWQVELTTQGHAHVASTLIHGYHLRCVLITLKETLIVVSTAANARLMSTHSRQRCIFGSCCLHARLDVLIERVVEKVLRWAGPPLVALRAFLELRLLLVHAWGAARPI